MKRLGFLTLMSLSFAFALLFHVASAQDEGSAKPRLAPGTLITIPPEVDFENTYNRADMNELLASLPDISPELKDETRFNKDIWAKSVRFQRDVWCLQFSFKPVRIVYVNVPNKQGAFDNVPVWYLVYNVKNVGPAVLDKQVQEKTVQAGDMEKTIQRTEFNLGNPGGSIGSGVEKKSAAPILNDTKTAKCNCEFCQGKGNSFEQTHDTPLVLQNLEGTFEPRPGKDEPIQFIPQFLFSIEKLNLGTTSTNDPQTGKASSTTETMSITYPDQVIPVAIPVIMQREGMTSVPETTVSIMKKELKSGEDAWGVAMWTGIDPRVNRFSIYVSGLTNIYRWDENADGGKRIKDRKTLKTNWWRVGDRFELSDKEIHYGFPGDLDYEWVYR